MSHFHGYLVLPLRESLVAAAVDGGHEEQGSSHADDGDDQRHAKTVLRVDVLRFALVGDVDHTELSKAKGRWGERPGGKGGVPSLRMPLLFADCSGLAMGPLPTPPLGAACHALEPSKS